MDRLVPAFVLKQYAAGTRSGRFRAAALFVDLCDFSTITNTLMAHGQHGSEVLATTMRAIFDPLVRIVYEQGGFITGFAGDGFTALFPGSSDDAALNALAAASRIGAQARRQRSQVTPYGAFESFVKCGLASGQVEWGIVAAPDEKRASYYFAGSAVDEAAAAEKRARPGETILTPELAAICGQAVEVEMTADYARLLAVHGPLPPPRPYEPPQFNPGLAARFLDPAIDEARTGGEFRQVVNVLISLPTVRTTDQLTIFIRTLFALQEDYGGLLNRVDFGDKGAHLVFFWGAPVAYENDVERALNLVLDLQMQTAIPLNAGVTYRIAHAGYIGGEWRGEYTCYGRGINLAARFMTTAPRGEIWVDENVVRQAGTRFEFERESELFFKGFSEPQKVYALLERKESVEAPYDGVLVGRESELEELSHFLAPLSAGRSPGMAVVWGEPGIGKSRLVHACRSSHGPEGDFLWALCQSDEIVRRSLNPFRYWLRHYFGISPSLSETRNKRSFNRHLDRLIAVTPDPALVAELDGTRSFLGALMELYWPDSLYEAVDAQARYEKTFLALTALLRAESLRRPVVILLEDAHWLDEDSKALLPRLLQVTRAGAVRNDLSYPIAFVVTARPEPAAQWLAPLADAEVELNHLEEPEVAEQVKALLGGAVGPALRATVVDRAEGNPFFAEQLVRYLQEAGMLELQKTGWDIKGGQRRPLLPASVRALLVARLDRLARGVREAVEAAAVLGREFEVQLLSAILGEDPSFSEKVEEAAEAGIWSAMAELRYLFRHALLHDTAYRTQVRARRQELHAQAVNALETLYAAELSGRYAELAYHCERGLLPDKARRYLELAGDGARADYQNLHALEYYRRALTLTPEADMIARYRLRRAQEEVLRLLGRQDEREETLAILAELAATMADPEKIATVHLRHGIYAKDLADYAEAIPLLETAAAEAQAAGTLPVFIEARLSQAMALSHQGRLQEANRLAEETLPLAQEGGDRPAQALLFNVMGMIHLQREAYEAAEAAFTRSLASAREAGARRLQALPLNNLGLLAGRRGDLAAEQRYFEQSLRITREIGDRSGEGLVLGNLGVAAAAVGAYETARDHYLRSLSITREVNDRRIETYCLINLGACLGKLGDLEQARDYAAQALQMAQEVGDRSAEAWALMYLGHARLAADEISAAIDAYQESLAIRRDLQQATLATEPAAGLADAFLAAGQPEMALSQLEQFLPQLEGGILEGTDDPFHVYHTAYRVLSEADDPRAGAVLEQAHTILQAWANRIGDVEVQHKFLERNPSHRAISAAWEKLGAPDADPESGPPTDGGVPPIQGRL